MPAGVYFNSSLTVSAWISIINLSNWAKIVECGNGPGNQNVQFAYTDAYSGSPALVIYKPKGNVLTSTIKLDLNKWQHVAFVLDYPNAYIYINGVRTAFKSSFVLPDNIFRTQCYIGKSNFDNGLADAEFDEIKIYNRSLSNKEILLEMNNDWCI